METAVGPTRCSEVCVLVLAVDAAALQVMGLVLELSQDCACSRGLAVDSPSSALSGSCLVFHNVSSLLKSALGTHAIC